MHFEELSIACVGARHANPRRKGQPTGNREMEIMFAARGDRVILEPEPTNQHDQNAVAVYSREGVQMGYVSADRTLLIRRAWEDAREVCAIFQDRTPWGAWIRVGFDREPTLPPEADSLPAKPVDADGYYADDDPGFDSIDWMPPDE